MGRGWTVSDQWMAAHLQPITDDRPDKSTAQMFSLAKGKLKYELSICLRDRPRLQMIF